MSRHLPRFSLRTLAAFLLLATSGTAVWQKRQAWYSEGILPSSEEGSFHCLAMSEDGRAVAATSGRALFIWRSGRLVERLHGHRSWCYIAGNRTVIAGEWLLLYDMDAGTRIDLSDEKLVGAAIDEGLLLTSLPPITDPAEDGILLPEPYENPPPPPPAPRPGTLRVRRLRGGECVREIDTSDAIVSVAALDPKGRFAAFSTEGSGDITIWPLRGGPGTSTLDAHDGAVSSVAVSPDGRALLTAEVNGAMKIWDTSSWELTLASPRPQQLGSMGESWACFSPGGSYVVTGSDMSIGHAVWSRTTGELLLDVGTRHPTFFYPDDSLYVVGWHPMIYATNVSVWKPGAKEPVFSLGRSKHGYWNGVTVSGDCRRLGTSATGAASVYDARTGEPLADMDAPHADALIHLDHAGETLAVCGAGIGVFRRRRPEQWWGILWMPEFWTTAALVGLFGWCVRRDRRAIRRTSPEAARAPARQ